MLTDYDAWKRELRRAIAHLLALTFQPHKDPTHPQAATFHGALARLYEDSQFPQFLALGAWQQAGLSPVAGEALQVFKSLLDAYDEPDTDAEIRADPEWHTILQQGAQVLDLLDESTCLACRT